LIALYQDHEGMGLAPGPSAPQDRPAMARTSWGAVPGDDERIAGAGGGDELRERACLISRS
jgi:hypothetical protein